MLLYMYTTLLYCKMTATNTEAIDLRVSIFFLVKFSNNDIGLHAYTKVHNSLYITKKIKMYCA